MVAEVRVISTSQLVQLLHTISFLVCTFKSPPLRPSKVICNAKHPSASTILPIQDGKRRGMMFTDLMKVLNKQTLRETCRIDFWLLILCNKQASLALILQCIGFLHTRDGSLSHQSPAKGYAVSSSCVHCSCALSSGLVRFPSCGYAAGLTLQGAKNLEVWRNYREGSPVVTCQGDPGDKDETLMEI